LKKALERALLLRKVRIAEEREKAMNERIPARLSTAEAKHAPRYSLQQFLEASASLQDMLGLAGQLLHSFSEHFMVGKGAVVVFDEGAGKLEVKACRGLDMEFLQEVKFNPHAGIYHWLRKHHRLLFLKELTDIPELDELALIVQEAKLLQAEVVAPLAGKTYPVGFLSLGGKFTGEPYSPEERENLFLLSRYAGGTIENALVFERTRGMAIRDELTQLYNRHYWKKSLAVEVERSKRYVRPLSVVIFDIDYFKAINDTRGHQAGDEVLKALARHLVKSSRHTDVLGRYGGEEFIAILPETVAELAYLYCERVRQDVEQKLGKKENAEFVHPGLTISGGMTTCDQKNDTPANIIERADRALYSAKREGRNRIHQAPPP
jgi:diguanylate cyclase (GGDEF)-like protein